MSVPLPAFRRVRLTQQCVIHPQDKGGNHLPCASEDWVLFVSLAADGRRSFCEPSTAVCRSNPAARCCCRRMSVTSCRSYRHPV